MSMLPRHTDEQEQVNADFAALGLTDDHGPLPLVGGTAMTGARALEAAAGNARNLNAATELLQPEAPVYRSVSSMMFQSAAPPAFRDLPAHGSCPSMMNGLGFEGLDFLQHKTKQQHQNDKPQPYESFAAVAEEETSPSTAGRRRPRRRVATLRRSLESYRPASVHALSSEASGDELVARVLAALAEADVDAGSWSDADSKVSCTVVEDAGAFRFDVYVSEMGAACKRASGASHIVEVQRVSSTGSAAAWAAVLDRILMPLEDVCFDGYFDSCAQRASRPAPMSMSRQASVLLTAAFGEDGLDDADLEPISEEVVEAELASLLNHACLEGPCWDARVETAQLLARLSAEPEDARRLVKIGAPRRVVEALQKLVLHGSLNDCARALCTLLCNLAPYADEVSGTENAMPHNLAALTTMNVLRGGNSSNHRDLAMLREAARALVFFSKRIHRQHDLREQVRDVAASCALATRDPTLAVHAKQILENVVQV